MSAGRPETWRQSRATLEYRPGAPQSTGWGESKKIHTRKEALVLDDVS